MIKNKLNGVSLFSSCGIGETYLDEIGINMILSNELLENRAKLHEHLFPNSKMVQGDILDETIFNEINNYISDKKIDFLLATPPCQGVSLAGKNKSNEDMLNDKRNYLIFKVIDFIKINKPKFILIENVPRFLKLLLPYGDDLKNVIEILKLEFSNEYKIDFEVMDSADYGVPQNRKRLIIKIQKKGLNWNWPIKNKKQITVKEAIGHLPSLESSEKSHIKWHYARKHSEDHIKWMKNTPSGKSAFNNEIHYPKKKTGEKIKGYPATYSRINWDFPAPTITMRNDAISSQTNVHPGNKLNDGSFSDARVLTPLELMILTSLPQNWNVPENCSETLIRQCIGECVPPLLIKKICEEIFK